MKALAILALLLGAGAAKPAPVTMTYAGHERNTPPFVTRYFDVTLRNDADAPRWFVLPSSLTQPRKDGAGVSGAEVRKDGGVFLADFQGSGAFKALRLPAHAVVTVRHLGVKSFESKDVVGSTPVEVMTATSMTIGGVDAEKWLGMSMTSAAKADVAWKDATRAGEKMTPDLGEVPVKLEGATSVPLTVEIPAG